MATGSSTIELLLARSPLRDSCFGRRRRRRRRPQLRLNSTEFVAGSYVHIIMECRFKDGAMFLTLLGA
ncbi:hypothetical protein QYE76_012746 [Lolium multiflorum]|uniref:Uncharacterized protein n=1 Tax=Lolium multiflorum TaxID=4521 RepID=A0AAD8X6Z3_LOLMU|nr:hypothetical protein QYE76_012746 [Lolium multiflorum]